jgi:predicted nucleic acid-binding protein
LIRAVISDLPLATPVELTIEIARSIARVPRDLVPDMPDRILAATALALGVPLVTRDERLRGFGEIETIW